MYRLFDYASLPRIREILWIWLKATVTNGYNKSLEFREKENILLLYEKLLKLIEASHLLYLQQKEQLQELDNQLRSNTEEEPDYSTYKS
jgi:hypothetical protein